MNEPDLSNIPDRGAKKWKMSMMLPEHKERISKWFREEQKKTKPEFDEQYFTELEQAIGEAKHERYKVAVRIFDEFDDIIVTGKVIGVDQYLRRLRMDTKGGPTSVPLADILSIEKAP